MFTLTPDRWTDRSPVPPGVTPREDLTAYGVSSPEPRPGTRRPPVTEWAA